MPDNSAPPQRSPDRRHPHPVAASLVLTGVAVAVAGAAPFTLPSRAPGAAGVASFPSRARTAPGIEGAAPPTSPAAVHTTAARLPAAFPLGQALDVRRQWLGPDGDPVPFTTHEEVLDYLRTARVVSTTALPVGWTKPKKVLLERDGVRINAIFRDKDLTQEPRGDPDTGQPLYAEFRDSAMFEPAAYELSVLLGLPFVPPAVARSVDNRRGSLQLWVENAVSEQEMNEEGRRPPNATWWRGLRGTLTLWDNLVFNADRNTGNVLINGHWDVWFVDHTRAFQPRRQLRNPQEITFCERRLWRRLQEVTDADIRVRLAPYLEPGELGALLARRRRLVELLRRRIDTDGIEAVIFDFEYDLDAWESGDGAIPRPRQSAAPRGSTPRH